MQMKARKENDVTLTAMAVLPPEDRFEESVSLGFGDVLFPETRALADTVTKRVIATNDVIVASSCLLCCEGVEALVSYLVMVVETV